MALAAATGGAADPRRRAPPTCPTPAASSAGSGLRSEIEGKDVIVPPEQRLEIQPDQGGAIPKIEDGPWPAFGRPDFDRPGPRDPGHRRDPDLREDVREPPLLRRQVGRDGRSDPLCDPHRAIVTVRAGFTASASRAPTFAPGWRCSSPPSPPTARSEIGNIRQIDRGYEQIDERLRALGARDRTRFCRGSGLARRRASRKVTQMIHPIPPGTRDVLARRDARASAAATAL